MNKATRILASVLGVYAGLLALVHGVFAHDIQKTTASGQANLAGIM